jgi:hypothetical protein
LRITAAKPAAPVAAPRPTNPAAEVPPPAMPSIISSLTIPPVRKIDSRRREWTLDEPTCAPQQLVSGTESLARQAAPLAAEERPAPLPAIRFATSTPVLAPVPPPQRAENAGPTVIRFRAAPASQSPETISSLPDRSRVLR